MSGALAERVFAHKITRTGFTDVRILVRRRFSIDDAARYPLFTDELIDAMRRLLPPDQHGEVATAITLVARKPGRGAAASSGASPDADAIPGDIGTSS